MGGERTFRGFVLAGLTTALLAAPALAVETEEPCYQVGYRFGRCAAQVMLNDKCVRQKDLEMPERCKGLKETEEGARVGTREVFEAHGLKAKK
ncbi:MAG: hypothetical protein RBS57_10160 [Desulforhabdus sp.]|nr:hypothetical protein [Desulforhabdus sp.]